MRGKLNVLLESFDYRSYVNKKKILKALYVKSNTRRKGLPKIFQLNPSFHAY